MTNRADLGTIDLHLVRVLHTVISERSVSRAALKLNSSQPLVSAQLKRLRALTGDVLLVRAGSGMAATQTALDLLEPAQRLLREADRLFSPRERRAAFTPAQAQASVRIAASDYLDPLFLPHLVSRVRAQAPGLQVELMPLSRDFDYRRALAAGEVDLVIGNWLKPPQELHLARLLSDEVVCLVSADHPAARSRQPARDWTVERYLDAEHVAPSALHAGAPGVIDEHLAGQGLARRIVVRGAHFGLLPTMVAQSWLVLTTGRLFCSRYLGSLPLRVLRCPVPFPPLVYYQLWHDLSHDAPLTRWLREQVREVARALPQLGPAQQVAP